ncbi:hypothetical protein PybrP1_000488 [[Pythium] brassicae (nom. inval.)]|nr:hypothetical protein PybrP1_000488 [[Pythium] brassicae (nom. inval.)]
MFVRVLSVTTYNSVDPYYDSLEPLAVIFEGQCSKARQILAIDSLHRVDVRQRLRRVRDGHLHLDTRLDRDRRDLLHDVRRRVQVDDALVDAHLEAVPRVGTLTTRRLARREAQDLGRETHWARHLQVLVDGAALEVGAHWLQNAIARPSEIVGTSSSDGRTRHKHGACKQQQQQIATHPSRGS